MIMKRVFKTLALLSVVIQAFFIFGVESTKTNVKIVYGSKTPISDITIFNEPQSELELKATHEQNEATRARNRAMASNINREDFLPYSEKLSLLKLARDKAITELKHRGKILHPDETIIDHSGISSKNYLFYYSTKYYYSGFGSLNTSSVYMCPGERAVVSTCDPETMYGFVDSVKNVYYYDETTLSYYHPTYSFATCFDKHGNRGTVVEVINQFDNCGMLDIVFGCSYSSLHGNYCGSYVTAKRFGEFINGQDEYIYKPELYKWSDTCYDQSKYFCSSTSCLTSVIAKSTVGHRPASWEDYCRDYYDNGVGAACPMNATCSNGKYRCDAGFKDAFHLDTFIADPNDCTACQKPRGCIPVDLPLPTVLHLPYNVSGSLENVNNYVNISLGNICGINITINGCTDDQFGDQYIELVDVQGHRYFVNDDVNNWRLCSRIKPWYEDLVLCSDAYLKLGCFGNNACGGTVEVTTGVSCSVDTYSPSGFTPCIACPEGLTNYGIQSKGCFDCADGYIGYAGTAPCVRCPAGTVEYNHTTCEICNPTVLMNMSGELYYKCLSQLLNNIELLEQRVDGMVSAFEQYLVDTKFREPTFPPTRMPTRRRRSRAPTSGTNV